MQNTAERRQQILTILCERRSEQAENLATEFGVTLRTIYHDIEVLACSYPIITVQGHGGGIRVMEGYRLGMKYLTDNECIVLERVAEIASDDDKIVIYKIIKTFSKPKIKEKGDKR